MNRVSTIQLKLPVVQERRAKCSECPHAVRGPGRYADRKYHCGLLYNGRFGDRRQPSYLPDLTEDHAAACPAGEWGTAQPSDLRGPSDPLPETSRQRYDELNRPLFHALWREIHTQTSPTPDWWQSVLRRLPCGECRRDAAKYTGENPPPFGEAEAFFAWAVELHNSVNRRTGKPEVTPGQARQMYLPT